MEEQWLTPHLDRVEELSRRFFRHLHTRLEQGACGISPSQYPLLRMLEERGESTVSEVAAHLGMSVAGATGLIDRLVRAGLVERRRDESDRRLVFVTLSPAGREGLAEARRLRRSIIAELMSALTREEVEQYMRIYEKMHASLRAE
ncbi:MAG: MarR family winged helix-turn-helix transcriptional regulator [Bacillota bacterium]